MQTLASYGHVAMVQRDSQVFRRAEAAARVIETATGLWRIGRGEPVDRAMGRSTGTSTGSTPWRTRILRRLRRHLDWVVKDRGRVFRNGGVGQQACCFADSSGSDCLCSRVNITQSVCSTVIASNFPSKTSSLTLTPRSGAPVSGRREAGVRLRSWAASLLFCQYLWADGVLGWDGYFPSFLLHCLHC